jgi:putative flippase GtrA
MGFGFNFFLNKTWTFVFRALGLMADVRLSKMI